MVCCMKDTCSTSHMEAACAASLQPPLIQEIFCSTYVLYLSFPDSQRYLCLFPCIPGPYHVKEMIDVGFYIASNLAAALYVADRTMLPLTNSAMSAQRQAYKRACRCQPMRIFSLRKSPPYRDEVQGSPSISTVDPNTSISRSSP